MHVDVHIYVCCTSETFTWFPFPPLKDYEIENKKLRETLAEYNTEFAEVKNQGRYFLLIFSLPDRPKLSPWRTWEMVNWAYLPILFLNLSSPRPAKTVPIVILLCLTPDDFTCQWRASGWERVNEYYYFYLKIIWGSLIAVL